MLVSWARVCKVTINVAEFNLREYCLAAWNIFYMKFLQKWKKRVSSVDKCSVASRTQVRGLKIWRRVEVLVTCILKLNHFTYGERAPGNHPVGRCGENSWSPRLLWLTFCVFVRKWVIILRLGICLDILSFLQ